MELIMAKRGWQVVSNDLSMLLFGIQDAALMAENMVIAAESLGMGSCFLGMTPYRAERIQKQYQLPQRFSHSWSWSWATRLRSSRPGRVIQSGLRCLKIDTPK
jgi:hypothetical protein